MASGVLGATTHPGQCDFDSWVTFPRDHNEAEVGSREVGSQRPGQERALLVSNHFLRGLDHHKLRLNVLEPHRRLFYPDWLERSAERPTHLLLEADPPEAVTRKRLKRRQPDAIIFHSCAWDLPRSTAATTTILMKAQNTTAAQLGPPRYFYACRGGSEDGTGPRTV